MLIILLWHLSARSLSSDIFSGHQAKEFLYFYIESAEAGLEAKGKLLSEARSLNNFGTCTATIANVFGLEREKGGKENMI